jgi:UDP-N-acetyl-D-galactosamine dehydrogenase|tara:strand:- start:2564 stop:3844 length:1281 start_codon:yes stop_codon:yes gene_type:complete
MKNFDPLKIQITILGLGYVGLPLALEFSKQYKVVGFDINNTRIKELQDGIDLTNEALAADLNLSSLTYTSSVNDIASSNIYIITVPTPIDAANMPDLQPLISASKMVGSILSEDDIVIYESTVYPGATEEICIPELENGSGFMLNKNFSVGYSPERINPGDKTHRLTDIIKVTSGSDDETAHFISKLYASIISAGVHQAPSIKVAEAAKVIENTQRDLNIALINELAIIFDKLDINTQEVLDAASTKWNFIPFKPGLVGGHCIGVDPYYLTYKAEQAGYIPEVILAGRKLNDNMGNYVSQKLINSLMSINIDPSTANILVMGLTFKENCPDLRNSKVIDVIKPLKTACMTVDAYDPWIDIEYVEELYQINIVDVPKENFYDAIIIAVAHNIFADEGLLRIKSYGKEVHLVYDLKSLFPNEDVDISL